MAKIYGKSDSLSKLINLIGDEKIKTFKDIISFKHNFNNDKKIIINIHKTKLKSDLLEMKEKSNELKNRQSENKKTKEEELNNIIKDLENKKLENSDKKAILKFIINFKSKYFSYKIDRIKNNYNNIVESSIKELVNQTEELDKEINFIEDNTDDVIKDRAKKEIERINYINKLLEENRPLVYGAYGELKVINRLKRLPDNFYIINNYQNNFSPPIYNKKENDRICSVQIDHLAVGPTGLFIIETKNWSKKSIEKTDLFSPVKQVKRASFALFVLLNNAIKSGKIHGFVSNWGLRKISPNNIVVSINSVPYNDFQYVKILSTDNLVFYIENRKEEFSLNEIKNIVNYLIVSNKNII